MKRIICFITILGVSIGFVFGQRSAINSLFLKSKMNPSAGNLILLTNEVKELLLPYYPGVSINLINQELLDRNPFFKNKFTDLAAHSRDSSHFGGLLNSIGSLDVTNLADGFAKFIVKRTKQELSITFFEKFRDKFNKPGFEDAKILFPQTASTLDAIGEEIYNYEAYINAIRESFESDMNGLPSNLKRVINDPRYNGVGNYFSTHPEMKSTCLGILHITSGLLSKVHPGKILANFEANELNGFDTININIKSAVQTLQLFSESLRSNGSDHYWISSDSLNLLLNDQLTLQIYLGLIYQKAENINFNVSANPDLRTLLSNLLQVGNSVNSMSTYLKGMINQTSILTQNISNISGKEKDKINFSDYYNLYNSALDLFQYASKINLLPGLSSLTPGPEFNSYLIAARNGGNIALDLSRKNYSSAVINTYQLYNFIFSQSNSNNESKKFLLKDGSFMAAVSMAQSSDDIERAIEAVALPSGSSRIKKETAFNVSVNAYCGLFTGYERIKVFDKGNFKFNSFGLSAPIGFSFSAGSSIYPWIYQKPWKVKGFSSTIFISLVDLGAIAAYRFTNDSTEQVPTIQLRDIFSPGVFWSIGLPKCPLSANFGVQIGPNLRKVHSLTNDFSNNTYIRYSVSVVVDLPLLNLYSKSW